MVFSQAKHEKQRVASPKGETKKKRKTPRCNFNAAAYISYATLRAKDLLTSCGSTHPLAGGSLQIISTLLTTSIYGCTVEPQYCGVVCLDHSCLALDAQGELSWITCYMQTLRVVDENSNGERGQASNLVKFITTAW